MLRTVAAALIALTAWPQAPRQPVRAQRDSYFARYPFDEWLAGGEKAGLRWSARVQPARLSPHQRLSARIEIVIDAKEIGQRRGRGELVTLVQIVDGAGRPFRIHSVFDLARVPADAGPHPLAYSQELFVVPGDYRIAMAVCDSETGEYSFVNRPLHVAAMRKDRLARAERDLPSVEFVRPLEAPDNWFQRTVHGRVHVGLETTRTVHVDLLMNLTPSERGAAPLRAFGRNMSVLVPALKVLAGIDVANGAMDVALLDLARRMVWEQKSARGLDWAQIRAPLVENRPGVIDVRSLASKTLMERFFRDQVLERARADRGRDDLRVVIVLSAPLFLENQIPLEPAGLERDPHRRIFYLCYRPPLIPPAPVGPLPDTVRPMAASLPPDDLEHLLKPLDARILTVSSPEDFRKALASVIGEIQKM